MKSATFTGFSLIEILITISLGMLIGAFAFPSISNFYTETNNQLSSQRLIQLLKNGRILAVSQQAEIAISKDNEKIMMYIDENHNGSITNASQLINVLYLNRNEVINWKTFPLYRNYILFTKTLTDNGTFWECVNGKPVWQMVMNKEGRIKVSNITEKCVI